MAQAGPAWCSSAAASASSTGLQACLSTAVPLQQHRRARHKHSIGARPGFIVPREGQQPASGQGSRLAGCTDGQTPLAHTIAPPAFKKSP